MPEATANAKLWSSDPRFPRSDAPSDPKGVTAMSHYKSNVRDIEFNLFELFGLQEKLGQGIFEEMDEDTVRDILQQVERLATNELAASFAEADQNPPVFDPATHTAPVSEEFEKSYQAWMNSGFWGLGIPEEIGGMTAPASLVWSCAEMVLG